MSVTITANNDAGFTSPRLVLGYGTARESSNVVHDLIGGGIAVALVPPRPRAGDLRLFYLTEDAAWESFDLHGEDTSFTLVDPDHPTIDMTYVLGGLGTVRVDLDEETRKRWIVTVGYQEIEP